MIAGQPHEEDAQCCRGRCQGLFVEAPAEEQVHHLLAGDDADRGHEGHDPEQQSERTHDHRAELGLVADGLLEPVVPSAGNPGAKDIDPDYRGLGLGLWLMETVVDYPEFAGLNGLLTTSTAAPLCERVGFTPLRKPEKWMERKPRS